MFENIPDICSIQQKSQLTCPHNQVFFTASAVWGLIGPSRQFGKGSIYNPQLYALVIGALIPFPFWIYQKYHPKSWVQYISTPIILNGVGFMPPATGINYSSWFAVASIFQYYIRRRNFLWWSKFNYVTSAALDTGMSPTSSLEPSADIVLAFLGVVLSTMFIFFTLQLPRGGSINVDWWGNNVWQKST